MAHPTLGRLHAGSVPCVDCGAPAAKTRQVSFTPILTELTRLRDFRGRTDAWPTSGAGFPDPVARFTLWNCQVGSMIGSTRISAHKGACSARDRQTPWSKNNPKASSSSGNPSGPKGLPEHRGRQPVLTLLSLALIRQADKISRESKVLFIYCTPPTPPNAPLVRSEVWDSSVDFERWGDLVYKGSEALHCPINPKPT